MRLTKKERHAAIRERAARALRNMYHNATPRYPSLDDDDARAFESWFQDTAQFEIEYIQGGGAYTSDIWNVLAWNGRRKYPNCLKAQALYQAYGLSKMRADRERGGAWERIIEYGTVYTWGRGGRTLAPAELISRRGGSSFSIRESYADDLTIADCVKLIACLESFNAFVESWCQGVPDMWAEHVRESALDGLDENAVRSAN